MGGAVPAGSSERTLVKPSADGDVVSCGIAWNTALRFPAKVNSLITLGLKLCSHEIEPNCVRVRVLKPEPNGTFPPVDAPFMMSNGKFCARSSMMYEA